MLYILFLYSIRVYITRVIKLINCGGPPPLGIISDQARMLG